MGRSTRTAPLLPEYESAMTGSQFLLLHVKAS
jgi:hypothetical protein